jgi:hypothetical protein
VVIMDGLDLLPEHLPLPERTRLSPELQPADEGEGEAGAESPAPWAPPSGARRGPRHPDAESVEREHILSALERVGGNRSLAAMAAGHRAQHAGAQAARVRAVGPGGG